MKGFEEEGPDDGAQPVTSDADQDDRARLIGEVIEAVVLGLGRNQAIMPSAQVKFAPIRRDGDCIGSGLPRGEGCALGIHVLLPLNSASVQPQSAREHFAQRGIRSK